jgi:Na+/citrate or Na+/malate symporter
MTLDQLEAEIAALRRQQDDQKKHWRRWGLASYAASLILCAAVLLKVALTGNDPPSPMIFIILTLLFVGLAFVTAGRPLAFARFRRQ